MEGQERDPFMVNIKEAVRSATTFVGDLYPQARDIRLEQVEPSPSEWTIVLSFRTAEPASLGYVLGTEERLFKEISVASEDGTPISLKVWRQ